MPIKNPDGSVYKLSGPNPAMKNQELWTNYIAHNMKFTGRTVFVDIVPEAPIQKLASDFIEELKTPAPIAKEEPDIKKINVYCLPAIIRERKDALYGENYQTIQYGDPFMFEAIPVKEEDLFMQMWTTVEAATQKGSVLYPKQGNKRWWKITERVEKSGGWLLTGVLSEYTPSFTNVA